MVRVMSRIPEEEIKEILEWKISSYGKCDSYKPSVYPYIHYKSFSMTNGEVHGLYGENSELCFARIIGRIGSYYIGDNDSLFMAFDIAVDKSTIPMWREYANLVLSSPLARLLCYNVSEFIDDKAPLVIRMTPNNTAWFHLIATVRQAREYQAYAEDVVRLVEYGVPLFQATKLCNFMKPLYGRDDILYVTPRATSHPILSADYPIGEASSFFGNRPLKLANVNVSHFVKYYGLICHSDTHIPVEGDIRFVDMTQLNNTFANVEKSWRESNKSCHRKTFITKDNPSEIPKEIADAHTRYFLLGEENEVDIHVDKSGWIES